MAVEASEIARVSSLVSDLARRDISGLTPDELMSEHEAVARLGRLTDTLQARYSGEIARRSTPDLPGGGLARQQGFGNAGKMISRVTGGSQAGALRSIEAGLALVPVGPGGGWGPDAGVEDAGEAGGGAGVAGGEAGVAGGGASLRAPRYPAVAEAALVGDLSVDAAALITAGLESLTDRVPGEQVHALERRLVDKAKGLAAHEVRRLVANAVARADIAGHEERERRQYAERFLTWQEDHTGMVTFSGRLDPVTAAPIRTVIEQMVTSQFRQRRSQDPLERDQRTVGQMRADALFELCRHALGCSETRRSGIRTTILVRMHERTMETGQGLGSIDGTQQLVSAGQLQRLAGDAGIVPEVLGGDSEVLDLGRTVRLFTEAQRLAMLERDGGCAKCHAPPEHCEAHHIRWWIRGGGSDISNGVMLCTRCHHDIHRYGWEIVVHANRVSFIPPPSVDPERRPHLGGRAAIELDWVDASPEYAVDGFFDDDEAMVREWERADAEWAALGS